MSTKKRKASDKQEKDEAFILGRFLEFSEGRGVDEFVRYLMHCGIGLDDVDYNGGDIAAAILENYRKPGGDYDLDAAAHDFFRWPPIAARVKELKRERWQKEASAA
jgi:hypothetical protein